MGRTISILILSIMLSMLKAAPARADDGEVWALMKKPGHIVLLRHGNAPESPPDADKIDFKNCATQRKLDEAGRAQAKRVGDEFRKHGIAHARLFSSQYCRAMDTASLTGLGPVKELPLLNQTFLGNPAGMKQASETAHAFMKKLPPGPLAIMVSHVPNIMAISGTMLGSGEFAVVHVDASGGVTVDGRIKVP
ncbi:MAG: histidine phosphatase family protein [Pseudolabrys sp.]